MKEMTKLIATALCIFAMLALGCGDTENEAAPGTSPEISKEEAAQLEGKSDKGIDLCEFLGWYDDGICDEFCVLPDPDCGPSGCSADSDCASGQVCQSGTCEAKPPADCGGRAGLTCGSDEFCSFAPDATCGATDKLGTCAPRPEACTQHYDPVCGCDGQTYGNACTANSAGVSVASKGECAQTCAADSDCADDQECVDGSCQESGEFCGGFAGFTCDSNEWCDYDDSTGTACGAADGGGTCQGRPENCAQVFDPVCGCDGMTYSNECVANAAGTDILATGPCN